jgi:phosphohistidine phosphatase
MKTLYLIRHAKSDWSDGSLGDFERGLNKRGLKDLKMMASYLALRRIKPHIILSSLALHAQETADGLAKKVEYEGPIHYMEDLYRTSYDTLLNTIALQENEHQKIFMVVHNPEITEFANLLVKDNIMKIPTLGILAIKFNIDSWEEIKDKKGKIDFFVHPKQFKYYIPKQIQATWDKEDI